MTGIGTAVTIADVFGDLPSIQTARLVLRKMRPEDATDMFEYASDPDVSTYTLWKPHTTIEETRAVLRCFTAHYAKGAVENWGIEYRKNGKFIGTCGYFRWEPEHARAEIQYALSRSYWGKGLMTEAVRKVIAFGFERMGLNRIEARVMVANTASERVLQKAGMRFEGIMREGIYAKGSFHDLKSYAILRRDV